MRDIIIGNVCSFCAMITNSVSGTRKKHREILGIQIISFIFYGVGSFILKGYSSTVQNGVGILRNLAAIKGIKNKIAGRMIEWILISLGVALGIIFNNRGILGWLPIIANLEYSIAVFYLKDKERLLRYAFIANLLMYTVFAAVIMDYVSIAANLIAAVTTVIFLIKDKAAKKKAAPDTPDNADDDCDKDASEEKAEQNKTT